MDIHLDLAQTPGRSLRARLERALRDAIQDGRLSAGTRLPATRALCAQLGVSRGVVLEAYAQLTAEGYLSARRGAGTIVAHSPAVRRARLPVPQRGAPLLYDLNPFAPALAGFPRSAWLAALSRVIRTVPHARLGYADAAGVPELRGALASYLGRSRGVRAEAAEIVICGGLRHGLGLLWAALAAGGARRVGVERPGWRGVAETANAAGLRTLGIPVDEHGLLTSGLSRCAGLAAVAVGPAHQYPTGTVMAPHRRSALIEWAQRHGGVIVEDDYDAEYRYDRHPVGALQGLAPAHVAYGGSASKTLAPAVRLGWLVLPQALAERVRAGLRVSGGAPAPLEQMALAQMIERGDLDRHLRRQRQRYRRRRDALLDALSERLAGLKVSGAAAGLFLVLGLPEEIDEQAVLAVARDRGIALEGRGAEKPALVLGYANLDESAAAHAVAVLAQSIQAAAAA